MLFRSETDDLSGVSWELIRTGELKKETEGLIFAAQDQALRTNAVEARIENQNVSSKCRMCGSHDETVQHTLCSCPKLAQTEYKKRYDVVGRVIHWEVCKEYGVEKWENPCAKFYMINYYYYYYYYYDKDNDNDIDNPLRPGQLF